MTAPDLARAVWRKSTRSTDQANCVEVAFATDQDSAKIAVRDSKNAPGPVLTFPATTWSTFLTAN
jgi:hypothetical protein